MLNSPVLYKSKHLLKGHSESRVSDSFASGLDGPPPSVTFLPQGQFGLSVSDVSASGSVWAPPVSDVSASGSVGALHH